MKSYRLLLFDMDGTILDTFDFHYAFVCHIFDVIGHPVTLKSLIPCMGVSFQDVLNQLAPPALHSKALQCCCTIPDNLHGLIKVIPYSVETLNTLRAQGWRTALLTNSPDHIIKLFDQKTHFMQCFDEVYPPSLTDVDKVSRCQHIFSNYKGDPEDFLYVGDSSHDMHLAESLGMDGCLVKSPWAWLQYETSEEMFRATYTIDAIQDILPLLTPNLQ